MASKTSDQIIPVLSLALGIGDKTRIANILKTKYYEFRPGRLQTRPSESFLFVIPWWCGFFFVAPFVTLFKSNKARASSPSKIPLLYKSDEVVRSIVY
jgi:hypothetical protein